MKLLDVQTQTGDAQNRIDRRETGRAGREEMKRNLRAENVRLKWGSSPGIDTGAPIMEPDGTVVAGNNRTMALQEMQDEQGDKASVYDAGARAMAARLGLDPKAFDGEPVALVRVAEPGLKTGKFVEQSNKAAVEQLSAADKAHADRRALASPGLLDTLDPLENGSFNTEFLTAFDKSLGSPKELRKPDGTLDLTATEKRAQAALLAHLLGKGSDTLLVSLMSNMEKPGIRQVVSALAKVGPALLNIESIAPERTILPHVGQALSMLVDFRRAKDAGQVKTVADWKAQGTLFAEDGQAMDPLTERILDSMASAKSPKSLADRFLKYAKAVEEYDPAQGALFGSVEPVASDYFAGQPGMKLDADGSENAGLWDIANAEPLEAKPVPEAERKKWEKVYRTLFALQREGPLKPAQQAMFDRAERVLGQRLLFGDADVKGTKGLESFKARWSSGGLKGTTDLSGDLFDEKAEGRVGKFAPGAAQGSLFAKHDPDQMGFSGDFATAGLDLWKRAGLAKAGPKADPGQLDLWAQQGGNVQRPTSNVQRPTEEVPTSTPAAAPTWELPFVLPEAVKPKVGDSAKTLAGKQRAANHLAAAHAAKAADVNDDAGEELKYNRRGRVMTGMKWQDFAALNPTLRTREATKAKVYPRPDYAQMIAGGMADIPAHFVKQVYDSMAATPQVRGELKDEDIQRYITGVNRVMEGALRWAGDKEAVGRWAQSQMPGAGPRSILDEMRAPKGLLESVYPGGDWKAHRDELIAIGGNKVLAALQPSRQEAMKATKDIKAGWPAAQESWQKQGWKVVKTSDAVKVGEGFDYSSKGASQERTPVFFARVLDRMGESFLTRAEAEAHIAGMKPALLLGKYGRIEGQFDTEEQAAEAARLKVKRDGKKTVSEKGTSVAVARRTGPEHRLAGEDIPTQKLVEAFGFRGVNFGNWMKGDSNARERQLHLNHAYDAFMDLAQVLGVPPQAMSLNGMLGIAFGAQGNGKHAAHFVPGLNEINLTREGGAGALAHEWGHGLDHYFAMLAGREREGDPYLSEKVGGAPASGMVDRIVDGKRQQVRAFAEELRPEIVAKFKAIVQAMNQRQETPEEVANRAAAQVAASKRGVESWLKSVAADATRAKVSEADFNRLADRIRAGDLGEGKVSAGNFAFSPVVDEVRDLFKKATGRVYSMDQSRGLQNSADWLKRQLEQKQGAEDHKPQMVSTDYQKASAEEDKGKGGKGYWNTTVEKFARAFDAFVTDEVKAKAQKNTYLSGIEAIAPQGTERTVIGQAFRDLVGTLKTRETERGTALFAKPEEKEPRKLDEPAEDGHGGGHERDIAARVEKALADLSRGEGGVSQDAYADVARNAGPIAEKQGVSREDGERLALIQWAVRNKRVIPPAKFANRAGDDGGVEHKVFYKEFGDRVGKVTLDKPQYPLEYLKRMALSDAVFASGEKLEGITFHPGSRRLALVISQDFVKGEHPTEPEIDAWMAARGFPKASDKTHGFYVGHGLVVADASPKNWIKNPQTGTLTPIDIRVAEHSAEQSQPFAKPEETGDELPDARVKDEGLKKVPKSSTQLTLNAEQAKPFLKFIQSIPEGEIYSKADKDGKEDYGRETEPHVTALYGLLNHDPVAASAAIAGSGPVTVKLGKLGMFESKDYDVLKVNVEGDSLHALNRRLRSQPYYSDYDDYKPHLTLAYLKKGEAKKYVGMDPFAGKQLTFDSVTFSPPSDGGLRDVIGKPEMPLNGGKLRPLGELKGEAGGAVVDFVAPKLKAGMAALATIGRVARGVEPTKPMRDLSQMGDDVLDQAVQHVGARSYAPVLVKSFMQDIFGPALGNAAFVKRVGDVIVMDNLLGGVDAMKVVLAKLKAKGAVAVMAPPAAKTGTLPGFPVPTGATEDQRTAAEKAQTTILEKKIADVEQSQPLDGMDVLVKDALAEPEIAAAIAQYRKVVMPAMDELYKEIKKVDPLAQLATRGRHFGARVNLMTKKQEQRMKEWLDPDKPMPQVGAGNASSYRNPDVKRDKFDRPADLTAEYSDNLEMMLLNSFGPRINEVTKERLYTALEKSGWGVVQKDGEDPATEIHGEETKPLSFTRYVTNPWGETTRATVLMDVPASKVETLRTVLATDMIPNQNPVAKALTGVQVLGIADATAHIKNQMSVVTHALGRDKNWQAVLSRLPFLGQMQAFVEIRSVAKAVTEGGPEITKEIAALAKHGMLRASGDEKGMLHAMSNLLHKYDTAARVIMARRYDNLVKAGWADDSMAGKRAFVMQVGEYNRRLMPWLDAKMRDYGLAPFIVAGRTFNRLGSRLVFGEPGFKNAEGKVPLKARAAMLTPWLTLLATATLANLLLSGSMFGRKGTPIGAIDLGPDHDSADGKRKTLDLLQMSGLRRGLRRTGLGAVVNGVKDGQGINDISKGMIEDSVTANAHPFMGPGLGFTIEALTGKRLDLRTGWTNPSETRAYDGGKQYLENARSALKHLNSLGYAIGKPAIGGAMNAAGMTMPVEDASGKGILGYGKDVLSTLVKTPASAVGYKETSSPALSLARKLQREHMPALPPDEAKQAQFMEKRGIYDQLRNKDQSGLAEGLKNGSIAPSQVKDILSRANAHPLVNAAHGLPLEQVQRIAALADEKEQAVLAPLIAHKTVNAAKAQMKKPMRTIPTR